MDAQPGTTILDDGYIDSVFLTPAITSINIVHGYRSLAVDKLQELLEQYFAQVAALAAVNIEDRHSDLDPRHELAQAAATPQAHPHQDGTRREPDERTRRCRSIAERGRIRESRANCSTRERPAVYDRRCTQHVTWRQRNTDDVPRGNVGARRYFRLDSAKLAALTAKTGAAALAFGASSAEFGGGDLDMCATTQSIARNRDYCALRIVHDGIVREKRRPKAQRRQRDCMEVAICSTVTAGTSPTAVII